MNDDVKNDSVEAVETETPEVEVNHVNDMINQSLLLKARGTGERLKGDLTARAEYMKAGASLLSMGSQSQQAGRLVIT